VTPADAPDARPWRAATPGELRALLELEVECAHRRATRELAVHTLALAGLPLLAALEWPTLLGRYTPALVELWAALGIATLCFVALESGARRRLDQLTRSGEDAAPSNANPR